jgi:hypothetical protein
VTAQPATTTAAGDSTPSAEALPRDDAPTDSRWTVAAAGTRTTAKWMIASLAAAAALIFGAGPIVSRPALSWTDNRIQLIVALIAGIVGLITLILLIGLIGQILTPIRVTL